MTRGDSQRYHLQELLSAVEEAPPVDVVETLAAELARRVGAGEVSLLIANFSGSALVRLAHVGTDGKRRAGHNEQAEEVPLVGDYEHVVWSQEVEIRPDGPGVVCLVPVTERGDAIGLLEVALASEPDTATIDFLGAAAHALAYVLIASRRHTDLFEWAQRDIPFSVAAEIQRRLLPSAYTVEGGPFSLAGWLEPSHSAGGDTFDYSIDRDHLYLSLTDAMGHLVDAALLATLAVGTLRNSRRSLATPAEQADIANAGLSAEARADQFVTGLLIRVLLADGSAEIVNAGHPLPYLVRHRRLVSLDLVADAPMGVQRGPYRSQTFRLEPGDRLLLVTDGYLERNADRVYVEDILLATLGLHPRQVVQQLATSILRATGGKLRDDATTLCVDWYGPEGRREATAGASIARATSI